jgi:hypothetical protein
MNKRGQGGIGAAMLLVILIIGATTEVKPKLDYRKPGSEGKAKLAAHAKQQADAIDAGCAELKTKAVAAGIDPAKICADYVPPQRQERRDIVGGGKYTDTKFSTKVYLVKEDIALTALRGRLAYDNLKIRITPVLEDWAGVENSRTKAREDRKAERASREWERRRVEEWRRATAEGRPPADWAYARPEAPQ